MKAENSKKVRGNGTEPKSIIRKGTTIAKTTTAPKTSSTPRKGQKVPAANNNNTKSGNQKWKGKGWKVSLSGKKGTTSTNLRK